MPGDDVMALLKCQQLRENLYTYRWTVSGDMGKVRSFIYIYISQTDCFCWIGIKLEIKILDLLVSLLFSINKNIDKRPKEMSILLLDMLKQAGALLKGCEIHKHVSFHS